MTSNAVVLSEVAMLNDLTQLRVVSQNLANANTDGYKRDIALTRVFDDVLLAAEAEVAPDLLPALSAPTRPTVSTVTDFRQGVLRYTGGALDLAIEGPDSYFELIGPQGVFLSRNGAFTLDAAGRLVNSSGLLVNGVDGAIRLDGQVPRIDKEGRVWENEDEVGRIKLVRNLDTAVLAKVGGGLLVGATAIDIDPEQGPGLRQGYLEASNVVLVDEMIRMIALMREFEASQRVVKGYDEMIDTAVRTITEF